MEAWFLADKVALSQYFGQGFLVDSLPARENVELILKRDIFDSLERAVRPTQKKRYRKTDHGFTILGLIDPEKVGQGSRHAKMLHELVMRVSG
jgi:hypothetical protein